jgi:hypothetical protein
MNNTNENSNNTLYIKPYTTKQLCKLYGISYYTFKRWVKPFEKEIGERRGWFYTVAQVKIIFAKLDYPELNPPETFKNAA